MAKDGKPDVVTDREWYILARPTYEAFVKVVCGTIEALLSEAGIDYLSVTGRAKEVESFVGKIDRKSYQDPRSDIHDLAGVRIVAYTESDVARIVDLIKSTFTAHPDKSLDKTQELGVDRAGYRSIHVVCDLGKTRSKLREYAPYKGLLVEVQVRTVLQHAWAEIEHDRNYKFAGVLPSDLQRRLFLAAGTLEMVDREFDSIAQAIEAYDGTVDEATRKGELTIPINTKSLDRFLVTKYGDRISFSSLNADERVISELTEFGLSTLEDLERLVTPEFLELCDVFERETTDTGFVRSVMMFADLQRYFDEAWQDHWGAISPDSWEMLVRKYGRDTVNQVLNANEVFIEE